MKIVLEYYTSGKNPSFLALVIILSLIGIFLSSIGAYPISLPKRIGKVNDYGNVLTRRDRQKLSDKLDQLNGKGIDLILLISTRDPYLNPNIFTSKIRAKWGIRGETAKSLVVFIRESDKWAVRIFLTTETTNLFSPEGLTKYRDSLETKAEAGEIRSGAMYAVNHLYRKAFPPVKTTSSEKNKKNGMGWVYIVSGIAGGILLLGTLLRWEGMNRCPRCGSRLKTSKGTWREGKEKYCPECGYRD
ncbi:hypothetical protein K9M06_03185 [Candidatus Bipolaricaulota bacterium]|nr:hypothetical protein [Candidatus Bipolaricaulota bacterium]